MSKKDSWKHVFCIEGLWDSDLRSTITIKPGLDLLQTNGFKYIYKDAATKEELIFILRSLSKRGIAIILYFIWGFMERNS
ncbi:MAG: hypothetical protein HUJ16_07295 [Kangiella sp.]|nr:hypothetical protein [Kangiella sp.]